VRRILHEHQPQPLPLDVAAELDEMEKRWWQEA